MKESCYEEYLKFAIEAHSGAKRKGSNIPYITHPMEVSLIVMQMTDEPEVIGASLLHDVVEDTEYTLNDIKERFGNRVAELVSYESENKRPELPAENTWKIRKEEFLQHLTEAPIEVKMISLADKLSNMRAMLKDYEVMGENLWNKFNMKDPGEQEWYYRTVAEVTSELKNQEPWQEYSELCDKLFGNSIFRSHVCSK